VPTWTSCQKALLYPILLFVGARTTASCGVEPLHVSRRSRVCVIISIGTDGNEPRRLKRSFGANTRRRVRSQRVRHQTTMSPTRIVRFRIRQHFTGDNYSFGDRRTVADGDADCLTPTACPLAVQHACMVPSIGSPDDGIRIDIRLLISGLLSVRCLKRVIHFSVCRRKKHH
jgi:hypothetical protein